MMIAFTGIRKRDIHRRPFEVCAIPEFDGRNQAHQDIVKLSKAAKKIVEKWGPTMQGGLATVRERTRELVDEQIRGIDTFREGPDRHR